MKFYNDLYIGEGIKNEKKIKRRLSLYIGQLSVYVLALCKGKDQLEIYHCAILKQPYYRKHQPYVVGLASSYQEALDLTVKIMDDAMLYTGKPDIKEFIGVKEKE